MSRLAKFLRWLAIVELVALVLALLAWYALAAYNSDNTWAGFRRELHEFASWVPWLWLGIGLILPASLKSRPGSYAAPTDDDEDRQLGGAFNPSTGLPLAPGGVSDVSGMPFDDSD